MDIQRTKELLKLTKQMIKFLNLLTQLIGEKMVFTIKEDKGIPEEEDLPIDLPVDIPPDMPEARDAIAKLLGKKPKPSIRKSSIKFGRNDSRVVLSSLREYLIREIAENKRKIKSEILGKEQPSSKKKGKKKENVDKIIDEMLHEMDTIQEFRVALFKLITSSGIVEGKYTSDGLKTKVEIFKSPDKWKEFNFDMKSSLYANSDDTINVKTFEKNEILNDLVYYFGSYGQVLDLKNVIEVKVLE